MKSIYAFIFLMISSCAHPVLATFSQCPDPEVFTCNEKQDCQGPWGTVLHGESIVAYRESVARTSDGCVSERRYCFDGHLDGSYEALNCVYNPGHQSPNGK